MDIYIFSLITTGILAIAAILAYLVQRARYLREIEPDLELKWPDSIRVAQMGSTLKEFWAFYIDIEVENASKNHAEDLRYEIELQVFPQRGKPDFLSGKNNDLLRLHPIEILAGRKTTIPVYIGSNDAGDLQGLLNSWDGPLNIEEAGFAGTVSISYFSKREFLLLALLPWRLGRAKYMREIFGQWWFQFDERVRPHHRTRFWEHPSLPKDVLQSVTSGKK